VELQGVAGLGQSDTASPARPRPVRPVRHGQSVRRSTRHAGLGQPDTACRAGLQSWRSSPRAPRPLGPAGREGPRLQDRPLQRGQVGRGWSGRGDFPVHTGG